MMLPLQLTEREFARQLEAAVAVVVEACARKDARILALEQENALLLTMLGEMRAGAHEKYSGEEPPA